MNSNTPYPVYYNTPPYASSSSYGVPLPPFYNNNHFQTEPRAAAKLERNKICNDLNSPTILKLYPNLQPNDVIFIDGYIPPNSNGFNINLQIGPRVEPIRDNVALNFGISFNPPSTRLNTIINNQWGEADSRNIAVLQAGDSFTLHILAGAPYFLIAINGQHYAEYPHRMPPNTINTIAVDGNVVFRKISWGAAEPQDEEESVQGGAAGPVKLQKDKNNFGFNPMGLLGGAAASSVISSILKYPGLSRLGLSRLNRGKALKKNKHISGFHNMHNLLQYVTPLAGYSRKAAGLSALGGLSSLLLGKKKSHKNRGNMGKSSSMSRILAGALPMAAGALMGHQASRGISGLFGNSYSGGYGGYGSGYDRDSSDEGEWSEYEGYGSDVSD